MSSVPEALKGTIADSVTRTPSRPADMENNEILFLSAAAAKKILNLLIALCQRGERVNHKELAKTTQEIVSAVRDEDPPNATTISD